MLGGSYDEGVRAITVDEEGNLYIAGMSQSNDFPVTDDAFQQTKKGPEYNNETDSHYNFDFWTHDAIISKLSADGSKLLYSTFYGGQYGEFILGITLNEGGFIVQLRTYSDDLYVSSNAYQKKHSDDKLNYGEAYGVPYANRSVYNVDNYFAIFSNPSFINITSLNGNTGENIALIATLKESMGDRLLSNKTVKFYINDEYVGSALTNDNGVSTFNYKIDETGGTYSYKAVYEGGLGHEYVSIGDILTVPESELFLSMISNRSNVKVGDSFTITYTLTNNGPDAAEDVLYSYNIPDGLEYVSSTPSLGTVNYDSLTKTVIWSINKLPEGKAILELSMNALTDGRFNLTPKISTVTYDESVDSIYNRYLTVTNNSNDIINENIHTQNNKNVYAQNNGNLMEDNSIENVTAMQETGNPISLLILSLLCIFVGSFRKFKR